MKSDHLLAILRLEGENSKTIIMQALLQRVGCWVVRQECAAHTYSVKVND